MTDARLRTAVVIACLCAALGCGGERAANGMSGSPMAGHGAAPGAVGAAAGPGGATDSTGASGFHLFGWLGPPPEWSSPARFAELKEVGFDLVLPAENDQGRVSDNLERIDLAAAQGMSCLLVDERFDSIDSEAAGSPAFESALDSITATYRDHPGFFGYYLGDEPRARDFDRLAMLEAALRTRDPRHPGWNNLLGRLAFRSREQWLDYTRAYLDRVRPAVLCNDQYDFLRDRDRGQFVENAAGLCEVARAAGLPCWGIVQLVEHGDYRALTPGELKWQVGTWLAYGARGIGYFTYWTPRPNPKWNFEPAVIARDGSRTDWFDELARFNRLVRAAGETLAGATWIKTVHTGSTPKGAVAFVPDDLIFSVVGRLAIGRFAAPDTGEYLLIANSDSARARPAGLMLTGPRLVTVIDEEQPSWSEAGTMTTGIVDVALEPGGFALVRLRPTHGGMP